MVFGSLLLALGIIIFLVHAFSDIPVLVERAYYKVKGIKQ